jgi:DNA invertase Pin-like site-specific DNA recombinase
MSQTFGYIRFSTKAQDVGQSTKRQRSRIEEYCHDRGLVVDEWITDLGKSAWKGHHLADAAGLGAFANRVRGGQVPTGSVLVVENIDRLSRDEPWSVLNWMVDLNRFGLNFHFTDMEMVLDENTLLGDKAMQNVQVLWGASLRAKQESDRKSRMMRSAWREKHEDAAKTKKVMSLQAPLWLTVRPDRSGYDRIEARVKVVRDVYECAAAGMGMRGIVKRLNDGKVEPWGAYRKDTTKGGWQMTSVRRLLNSPQVEGDYIPSSVQNGQPEKITGYYPRILDADLVARARAGMAERATGRQGNRRMEFRNLFSGLVSCSHCSGKMEWRKPSGTRNRPETMRGYLICGNAHVNRGCSQRTHFRYGAFEDAALDTLLDEAMDDSFFVKADESREKRITLAETQKQIADLRDQARNIAVQLSKRPSPTLDELLGEIENRLAELHSKEAGDSMSLLRAQGQVSPGEHLQRIAEVRNLLSSSDDILRVEARARVTTALKGIVDKVWCDGEDHFEGRVRKTLTVVLFRGVRAYKFENLGGLIGSVDNVSRLDRGLGYRQGVGSDDPRREQELDQWRVRIGSKDNPPQTAGRTLKEIVDGWRDT